MSDAEKVREALSFGPEGYPAQNKEPVYIWSDAEEALDSILTELAEAKEQQFTIQELRVRSDAVAAAEERAEKAERRLVAAADKYADYNGLRARIQELKAENERLRQGLVEALEEQP